eukprot:357723-Chlamydomonas_euryale.AAC.27
MPLSAGFAKRTWHQHRRSARSPLPAPRPQAGSESSACPQSEGHRARQGENRDPAQPQAQPDCAATRPAGRGACESVSAASQQQGKHKLLSNCERLIASGAAPMALPSPVLAMRQSLAKTHLADRGLGHDRARQRHARCGSPEGRRGTDGRHARP